MVVCCAVLLSDVMVSGDIVVKYCNGRSCDIELSDVMKAIFKMIRYSTDVWCRVE